MEYVALRAVHPTYLNLQLPTEAAEFVEFRIEEARPLPPAARGIAFLARGPGVVRVVTTLGAGDLLPLEILHNRYLATAMLTERLIFNLPEAVVQHLGMKVQTMPKKESRFTDDGLLWFLPAPEYYEFRARQRSGRGWEGPAGPGLAHLYLARSVIPWANELETIEKRIDSDEWRPRLEALQRVSTPRARRTSGLGV
jgi:hypothetical protein